MMSSEGVPEGYKQTKVGVVPKEWEVVKLKNIATVETGKTPLRTNNLFWDNGTINWVTTTKVNKIYIDTSSEKITKFALKELKMKLMPINTILLAMYGQGKTRGKVALLKIESTINQAFASIKPNEKYSTNFLLNYLDKSYMKIRNLSHGSNQDNLNLDTIKYLDIPLPPLREQQKIAEILTTWDDAISCYVELIKAKEQLKKGLMQKLLSGEVRFSGFDEEWKKKDLDELVEFFNGKAHEKDIIKNGKYIVVNSKFISTNGKIKKYANNLNLGANIGDIVMVMSDVPNGKAIAKCFYIDKKDTYTINQRICLLKPTKINSTFLFYILNRHKYYLCFDDGVKQTNLRKEDILTCPLRVPSLVEQQKIAQILSTADKEIELLKNKLEVLKEQKKGLIQELLTGEMRVKV